MMPIANSVVGIKVRANMKPSRAPAPPWPEKFAEPWPLAALSAVSGTATLPNLPFNVLKSKTLKISCTFFGSTPTFSAITVPKSCIGLLTLIPEKKITAKTSAIYAPIPALRGAAETLSCIDTSHESTNNRDGNRRPHYETHFAKKSSRFLSFIMINQKDGTKITLPLRSSKKTGITVALWRTTNIPEY